MSSATLIRVGDRYVEFVTEERLVLTDDREMAAAFTWEGSVRAEELVRFHLSADERDARDCGTIEG